MSRPTTEQVREAIEAVDYVLSDPQGITLQSWSHVRRAFAVVKQSATIPPEVKEAWERYSASPSPYKILDEPDAFITIDRFMRGGSDE